MLAAAHGNCDVISYLLKEGAVWNALDRNMVHFCQFHLYSKYSLERPLQNRSISSVRIFPRLGVTAKINQEIENTNAPETMQPMPVIRMQ